MKTMKRFFSFLLLLSLSFASVESREKVVLNSPLLKTVDGIPGAMDAASFKQCFDTWGVINNVQYKDKYPLEEREVTLKEIVILELKYRGEKLTKEDQKYKALMETLGKAKVLFKEKTEHLLQAAENPATKETNRKLVMLWIKTHNKKDSLLNSWGTADQDKILLQADAKTFFVFLNDLKFFLEDLMYSCPKARKAFKEECLKPEDFASFEKFFTNS